MNKLNILLTNDDSYNSSYLHIVKDELKKIGHDVSIEKVNKVKIAKYNDEIKMKYME